MFPKINHANISKASKAQKVQLSSKLLVVLHPQWALFVENMQSSKQKVIKKTPIFFRLFMTQGRCSSGANLLLRSRGGAPEELWLLRSQGRSSSGARLGAPDEHPWVGAK